MKYSDDRELERSAVVANCRMNRERQLLGTNGYDVEIGFDPLAFLRERGRRRPIRRWLDLCCGTGRALIEAAAVIKRDDLPIEIVGVDLVGMFHPADSEALTLIEASVSMWKPNGTFDLVTCIHGLHYLGDKLRAITRACSWLRPDGLFVANLDLGNLTLIPEASDPRRIAASFRRAGIQYHSRKRLLRCEGRRQPRLPFKYVGADDDAGPNVTGQPTVNSNYEARH
jgi:SAM-dependent methyltransferase